MALVSPDTACVVDQYMVRGYCVDVNGDSLTFGRAGEGPGELSPMTVGTAIASAPNGDIIVSDSHLQRITRFTTEGAFVSSAPTGGRMFGLHARTDSTVITRHREMGDPVMANAEIHIATGDILRKWLPDPAVVTCGTPVGIRRSKLGDIYPAGRGIVQVACFGEFLLWYPDGGKEVTVIPSPTYTERYPSMETAARVTRQSNGTGFDPGYTAESFSNRAYWWYGSGGVDARGRLWIVRILEDEGSYVDVYDLEAASFLWTVELQGEVTTIAVSGDRLIARGPRRALVPDRVYWYELPEE